MALTADDAPLAALPRSPTPFATAPVASAAAATAPVADVTTPAAPSAAAFTGIYTKFATVPSNPGGSGSEGFGPRTSIAFVK